MAAVGRFGGGFRLRVAACFGAVRGMSGLWGGAGDKVWYGIASTDMSAAGGRCQADSEKRPLEFPRKE